MSQQPNGIHHIAIMCGDIRKHIAFFSEVVGFPLVALFDMHGVPGGLHAFLRMNDFGYFSLVQLPDVDRIPIELGVTHSGSGAAPCAPGTLQHLAFRAANEKELIAMRDRIRSRGVNVFGPIDHGMCQSIYFAGPEQLSLEVAWSDAAIEPKRWIDPTTLAKIGVTPEEAKRLIHPDAYDGEGGTVPQPPIDPTKPHQAMPEAAYKQIMSMPDEVIWKVASYAEPPVKA